jgi:ubiquinone/menaquinone biosynthesis C-methylase UbiE
LTNRDVEQFNERAEGYDERFVGRHFHREIQQQLLGIAARLVPAPQAVLDVGCGTGSLLRSATAILPTALLCGIDPAEQMLAVARGSLAGAPCGPARVRWSGAIAFRERGVRPGSEQQLL